MREPKIKWIENKKHILDPVRCKYVVLTPEEEVRQMILNFLHFDLSYPFSLMMVEKQIVVNDMERRFDIACADKSGKLRVLIECKAPDIAIDQKVFDQLSVYNISAKVDYLVVSNGETTYACKIDYVENEFRYIQQIPSFESLH